jgi:Domain of unknown function (DUF4139)
MKKLLIITGIVLSAIAVNAQVKTTKVSVFKNGTFFQKKEGNMKITDRVTYVDVPSTALLGTYWIASNKDAKIQQIDVRQDTIKKTKNAQSIPDYLQGNEGKTVTLRYNQVLDANKPAMRSVTGTLVKYNPQTGLIKLKTDGNKMLIISISNLNDVEFDASVSDKFEADTIVRRAKIQLEKAAGEAPFTIVSMQTGIQWSPSYYIRLVNDKDARLVMKGTVENHSEEDLSDVDLDLVVGAPQMFFGSQYDPISLSYLTNLITSSYGNTRSYALDNRSLNIQTNTGSYYDSDMMSIPIAGEDEFTADGEKIADLYYYKAGKISLKKNTKTLIPLSLTTIPYKDVYEAEIGDITNYYVNRTVTYDEMQRTDAFHSLKFTNKSGAPITTAPVFVVDQDEKPLAQDQIKYTSPNADVLVRLSKAIDVSVKSKDEELTRTEKVKKYNKAFYDKITLKGTVELANYLDKPITLNLKKQLNGEVTKSDGASVSKSGRYNSLNPYSTIKWEVQLGAGEKKTITFEYDVYITTGY